jgi:hypothetical protein
VNQQQAAQIIAKAAADLKATKPTEAPADRVATAKRKALLNGANNSAADRNRAELTHDEWVQVVSVNQAQAELARSPEKSPSHIDRSNMLDILASELDQFQQWR